mmetsp:Transcript_13710/g.40487  ORF Transcript_13710/g.40487 Transcript_13710/m.40487 type:complete len:216 (-) Transcript_13710:406-1053(-)
MGVRLRHLVEHVHGLEPRGVPEELREPRQVRQERRGLRLAELPEGAQHGRAVDAVELADHDVHVREERRRILRRAHRHDAHEHVHARGAGGGAARLGRAHDVEHLGQVRQHRVPIVGHGRRDGAVGHHGRRGQVRVAQHIETHRHELRDRVRRRARRRRGAEHAQHGKEGAEHRGHLHSAVLGVLGRRRVAEVLVRDLEQHRLDGIEVLPKERHI